MPRLTIGTVVAVLVTAGFAAPAYAGAAKSFVSGGGTDVGTCERTAPCRTFGYAIGPTNAGGQVVAIDSASYGPVTITKAISLIAPRGVYAGISASSGDAITVSADASDDVVLRNLVLHGNGAANGVVVTSGRVSVEDSSISRFSANGISAAAGSLAVSDTRIATNGNNGIFVNGSAAAQRVNIDHCNVLRNNNSGLLVTNNARGEVEATRFVENNSGVVAQENNGTTVRLFLDDVIVAHNVLGIGASSAGGGGVLVQVHGSTVVNNNGGILPGVNADVRSFGDNVVANQGFNGFSGTDPLT